MEQLRCPRCGNHLVKVCERCGTVIHAERDQAPGGWRPNISHWSRRQLALFWLACIGVMYSALSTSPENIGVALPAYAMLILGVPYALIAVTLKWRASRH
jgi:hypothetical protein